MVDTMDRTGSLFEPGAEAPAPVVQLDGPTLRVVYWTELRDGEDVELERPCLVRCDGGQRNVVSIRKLSTLCGASCESIARTTRIPPADVKYCQACHALSGNGVIR